MPRTAANTSAGWTSPVMGSTQLALSPEKSTNMRSPAL